jgi:hypothetical protein
MKEARAGARFEFSDDGTGRGARGLDQRGVCAAWTWVSDEMLTDTQRAWLARPRALDGGDGAGRCSAFTVILSFTYP